MGIIKSILDNDLYKYTQQQAVLHNYPGVNVKYKFKLRGEGTDLRPIVKEIINEIQELKKLSLKPEERRFMEGFASNIKFLSTDYLDFLQNFRFDSKYVKVELSHSEPGVNITVEGPWVQTILFEVPILAIVNELYFEHKRRTKKLNATTVESTGMNKLSSKINHLEQSVDDTFKFADFGTRRRYSFMWQKHVVTELKKRVPGNFVGTSNVYLAMRHNVKAIGTMAHEWIMAHQQLSYLKDFQKDAFKVWADEYKGSLGIALTDTLNNESFINDFDGYLAKLYDGLRHDSGDPDWWGEKMLNMYRRLEIDPKTKTLVFSDGLDFNKAISIYDRFRKETNISFGIGTNLTNDVGFEPLSIVMKLIEVNGEPVAKISNNDAKNMCEDPYFINHIKRTFKISGPSAEYTTPSEFVKDIQAVNRRLRDDLAYYFGKDNENIKKDRMATSVADCIQVLQGIIEKAIRR